MQAYAFDVRGKTIDEVDGALAQWRAQGVPEGTRCFVWTDATTGQPEAVVVEVADGEGEGQ